MDYKNKSENTYIVDKNFYVSPFFYEEGRYSFKFSCSLSSASCNALISAFNASFLENS